MQRRGDKIVPTTLNKQGLQLGPEKGTFLANESQSLSAIHMCLLISWQLNKAHFFHYSDARLDHLR